MARTTQQEQLEICPARLGETRLARCILNVVECCLAPREQVLRRPIDRSPLGRTDRRVVEVVGRRFRCSAD